MSCSWRLVWTLWLLLALPLKGLAAVGAAGCAPLPPGPVLAQAVAAPCHHGAGTEAAEAAAAAGSHDAADSHHAAEAHAGHGPCHHGAPCCVSLALLPQLAWWPPEPPQQATPITVGLRLPSVTAPLPERPPKV